MSSTFPIELEFDMDKKNMILNTKIREIPVMAREYCFRPETCPLKQYIESNETDQNIFGLATWVTN